MKKFSVLMALGVLGIISVLPSLPNLIAFTGETVPVPIWLLQLVSLLQSSLLLAALVGLGCYCAPKVGLLTPLVDVLVERRLGAGSLPENFAQHLAIALVAGIVGGLGIIVCYKIFAPSLPNEFLANAEAFKLPVLTRLLYGGITEELMMRWGVMSGLVFAFSKLAKAQGRVPVWAYIAAIIFSALLFAAGHLPIANLLAGGLTAPLVAYILLGNSLFALVAGVLYWRWGLEAAILAHMAAHGVMVLVEGLLL